MEREPSARGQLKYPETFGLERVFDHDDAPR
jgi:hypothetical protein